MSGLGIIQEEPPQACEMCGAIEETRPYGPNGEQVCFNCGINKVGEEILKQRMAEHIFGEK